MHNASPSRTSTDTPTAVRRTGRSRRDFAASLALAGLWYAVQGAFAGELVQTPRQTEGPFFPDKLPLDTDNDLIVINSAITPAVGKVTWLSGRVLDARGEPVRGTLVEIWQVDNNGAYLHSRTSNREKRDSNFQGYGRFLTGRTGEYLFRTIKPVPYPGRTPHIHFALHVPGRDKFTTQCYVEGEPLNETDGVLKAVRDPQARGAIIIPFTPVSGSRIGEVAARFDIVLGFTPQA